MESLNEYIQEYKIQLSRGYVPKAYQGIMTFMSGLKNYLEKSYPNYVVSSLYFGYMDMTYFAFTPTNLKNKKLKIAIVFLHQQGRFDVWLSGSNRKIQAEYLERISHQNTGKYKLSSMQPGVDSIIESILVEQPDFNHPEELKRQIEKKVMAFLQDMTTLLNETGQ